MTLHKDSKKINLLYDASVLANASIKDSSRSGIFMTAINILNELVKKKEYNIYFFCKESSISLLCYGLNSILRKYSHIEILNKPEIQTLTYSNYLDLSNSQTFLHFYPKEKNGIWSTDDCYLKFMVKENIQDLKVVIFIENYFPTVKKMRILDINNKVIYATSKKKKVIGLNVPVSSISPNGLVELNIKIDGCSSVKKTSGGNDSRELGIMISKCKVILNNKKIRELYHKFSLSDKIIYLSTKIKEKKGIHKLIFKIKRKILSFLSKEQKNIYKNIDVFFSPMDPVPEDLVFYKHIKKFVLIYDMIPLLYPAYFPKKHWIKKLIKSFSPYDYYFTISENTKRDTLFFSKKITEKNITTTYLGCAEYFRPEKKKTVEVLKKYKLPTDKKYIFSLCTLEPRKNLIRAIKCFIAFIKKNKIDDLIFILGGGHWEKFITEFQKGIKDLGLYQNKIIRAGYIEDEDLPALYSGAEWFVYTSQYEGFGLPPLEAMSCGCPVITSNNSSLPEVVGDAGQMIDWDSDEQHIAAYEKYYFNQKYKNKMAKRGLKRSKQFSWKKCVDTMSKEFKR